MNGKVCLNCNTLVQYPDFTTETDIQCPSCGFYVVGHDISRVCEFSNLGDLNIFIVKNKISPKDIINIETISYRIGRIIKLWYFIENK